MTHDRPTKDVSTNGGILDEIRTIPLSYDPLESEQSALQLCLATNLEWENDKGQSEFVPKQNGIINTLIKVGARSFGTP